MRRSGFNQDGNMGIRAWSSLGGSHCQVMTRASCLLVIRTKFQVSLVAPVRVQERMLVGLLWTPDGSSHEAFLLQ